MPVCSYQCASAIRSCALQKIRRCTGLSGVAKYSERSVTRWKAKIKVSPQQRQRRIAQMDAAFPEASVEPASCLVSSLTGVPDEKDRHVLAAAIAGHAQVIVTNNLKHFPQAYLIQFDILCQSADDFLIHQFHLNRSLVIDKLDGQAVKIHRQMPDILSTLKMVAPKFVGLVEMFL